MFTEFKSLELNCYELEKPPGTYYSFMWKTYQASFKMSMVLCWCSILPEIMHKGAPEVLARSKANV
jgi:hypothetical protein